MIGRIVRPADFERVLAAPLRSRSPHFAVHYLADRPGSAWANRLVRLANSAGQSAQVAEESKLSTGLPAELSTGGGDRVAEAVPPLSFPVDNSGAQSPSAARPQAHPLQGHWLGLVVPKRHAKRAVTRNLIKRQVRALMAQSLPELPPGLWVIRLRAPFERQVFASPASDALRSCAHDELATLLDRAIRSPLPPRPPRSGAASSRPARR